MKHSNILEKQTQGLATAEARAARLRRLRNMANLNRNDMCNSDSLNINTYKGWEIARYGGLPVNAAAKVIKRLSKAGVICAKEWLLMGVGPEPYVLPQPRFTSNPPLIPDESIISEIAAFSSLFSDTIYTKITDDSMLPFYSPNDYVAGIKVQLKDIEPLLNTNCIVLTDSGELLVRYLKSGSQKGLYTLYPSNVETTCVKAVMADIQIECVARIVRHYKL